MKLRILGVATLFVIVTAIYLPSVRNGFVYDDMTVILVQPTPESLEDVAQIFRERHFPHLPYYRPIVRTTLLLQKSLHGDVPGPFHAVNAVLMGLAAVAAYGLLRQPRLMIGPWPALLAAVIFALHPVASSCVYPIASGRETLLPALVMIAAVWTWLHAGRGWYVAALLFFAASLFCKEQAIVLPVVLLAADAAGVSAEAPGRDARRWLLRFLPLVPIVAVYLLIRYELFEGKEFNEQFSGEPLGPLRSLGYALQTIVAPLVKLAYEPPASVVVLTAADGGGRCRRAVTR